MDYDLMFVGDGRNANVQVRPTATVRPGSQGSRSVVVQPGGRMIGTSPSGYYQSGYNQQPYYQQPYYQQPPFASRFGLSTGELIDSGIQLFAAVMPLPAAPVAQGDTVTDIENQMTYQQALAVHAKRDEQLRTLGTLLTRILR